MTTMVALVLAQSQNRAIGKNNDLPWHLPADLRHFREITTGHPVIMGRKTFQSIYSRIGKALPDRENVVISTNPNLSAPGARVVQSLTEALELHPNEDVYVIGGARVFDEALPAADRIYLTQVKAEVDGDTFFAELDPAQWRVVEQESHEADARNQYAYEFITLERVT